MVSRLGVCSLVALGALVFAATGQAQITPGPANLGSSSEPQALTPPIRSGDRHATAASWHDGTIIYGATYDCITGAATLGGSYVGWFGEVGSSPVVNQTYYVRVGWAITANPCTGGAYVHTEIQLPSFTSLAITGTNKVRCFYKSPNASSLTESPSSCPQAPTSIGLYGGLSFDPVGATAWPSAFGSIFEIWIPVKTTQPLDGLILGGSSGCPSCLFAGTWMIDGWFSPWLFPVQGVYVKQAASPPPPPSSPSFDYPTPNHYESPALTWWMVGYIYTAGLAGIPSTDVHIGTSGDFFNVAALAVAPGNWRLAQSFTGLTAGATYQFRMCFDPDGAAPRTCGATQTFVVPGGVDTTAPNTSIVGKPAAFTNKTSATFSFSANELGSTFFCKLDGGSFAACTAPTYNGLGAGSHTLAVYARDLAGNADATPASYSWTIDLTKPATTITSKPPAKTSSRTAKFRFSSREPGTFQCKLDSKPWAKCASPKTYKSLARGRHKLSVYAIDRAGNKDATPATYSWRIT